MIGKKQIWILIFMILLVGSISAIYEKTLNDRGIVILKEGEDLYEIPEGYDVKVSDGGDTLTFTNTGEAKGVLEFKEVKMQLEKDAKVEYVKIGERTHIDLEGEGSITADKTLLNNIKDAKIRLDKDNQIGFAEFTSTEQETYEFNYNNEKFVFEANMNSKVVFNPEEREISGENLNVQIGKQKVETYSRGNFKWNENGYIKEAHLEEQGRLTFGETEIYSDKGFEFYSYSNQCEKSKTNCVQVLQRERIKNKVKAFTNDLDIFVREEASNFEIASKDDVFDDITIKGKNNKLIKGSVVVSLEKSNGEISILELFKGEYPIISNAENLETTYHMKYIGKDEKIHDCHIDNGEMVQCSVPCNQLGYSKYYGDKAMLLELEHPAYNLDGHQVTIGGKFKAILDKEWYAEKIKQACEYGVDPNFWVAFSMEEYGGKRVTGDIEKKTGRVLTWLPVGEKFIKSNGAGGMLIGDTEDISGIVWEADVQKKLRDIGAPEIGRYYSPPSRTNVKEMYEKATEEAKKITKNDNAMPVMFERGESKQEDLDAQSFIFLKKIQDRAMYYHDKRWESIDWALQTPHGMGELPYLYEKGKYGEGKDVFYNGRNLEKGRPGKTGIKGADHPIYGYSIKEFVKEIDNSPIKQFIPSGCATPVTDAVINA